MYMSTGGTPGSLKLPENTVLESILTGGTRMALYKKLDLWSVYDGLEKMMDYCYNGNEKNSPYWNYYFEQVNELSIIASELYEELDEVTARLWRNLPDKKISFSDADACGQTATAWFNTAAAMLHDTDMTELLENENIYHADFLEEKKKRISAFGRLTKHQQLLLHSEVTGFLMRYLELSAAFDTIEAVITELEHHQAAIARGEKFILTQTAYAQ